MSELNIKESTLVDLMKSIPSSFLPEDVRKTVKDIKPDSRVIGGTYTSKDKEVLGVPRDNKIVWVPFHMNEERHQRFSILSDLVGRPSFELGCEILSSWYDQNEDEIETLVQDKLKGEKTDSDLEKEIEVARRKMEKAIEMLKSRKG